MQQRDIIFLLLDTARADSFGCLGASRDTTPVIDSLASDGLVYEQAYSNSIWSLPAYASIFTGELPSEHGAVDWKQHLDGNPLVENLRANGYRTGCVSPHLLSGNFGLSDAFDVHHIVDNFGERLPYPNESVTQTIKSRTKSGKYNSLGEKATDFISLAARRRSYQAIVNGFAYVRTKIRNHRGDWDDDGADEVLNRSREFLDSGDGPRFLFANFIEPHAPYRPPAEYIHTYLDEDVSVDRLEEALLKSFVGATAGIETIGERDSEILRALYDAEVRYLDDRIGEFLQNVEAQSDGPDPVVVIASDHGDLFGKHGIWGHQAVIDRDLAHVPLIVSHPDLPSGRVESPVSLRQLYTFFTNIAQGDICRVDPCDTVVTEYFGWDTQLSIEPWNEYENVSVDEYGQYQVTLFHKDKLVRFDSAGTAEAFDLETDERLEDGATKGDREFLAETVGDPHTIHREYRESEDGDPLKGDLQDHLENLGYM
ncbi:sulfatase [Halomicrobium sp. LC1Hm]|uniref:sulfatase n=1 Tax=Halomicrobium sp. LC1Hm TaxID=2610902 RepID=UPI00129827F8|nr:sulfatase [Halomicrobium sp. LC1Hm]QGA81914.1 Arylsulfatase A [Halomicrobium sp. LC1Hm]